MVAKSYQYLPQVTEPYTINNKTYVKVRKPDGSVAQVRWYDETEYRKYYGEPTAAPASQKEAFGFTEDYITIFKGDTYPHKDYFKANGAKYNPYWGWYFPSGAELPTIPADITTIRLAWETIGQENGLLKTESVIKAEIAKLTREPSTSKFVGEIGQRIDITVRITRAVPLQSYYGGTMYSMEDADSNVYVWRASTAKMAVGNIEHIRGTIKQHNIYNEVCQTILSHCKILDKLN